MGDQLKRRAKTWRFNDSFHLHFGEKVIFSVIEVIEFYCLQ